MGWACCWLSSLLRGVFSGFSDFPPSTKIKVSKFQFNREFKGHVFVSDMTVIFFYFVCLCVFFCVCVCLCIQLIKYYCSLDLSVTTIISRSLKRQSKISWKLCREKTLTSLLIIFVRWRLQQVFTIQVFLWFSSLYIFSIADLPFPVMNSFFHSQKPSLYRSLVYADLAHSTTSNTGPVKRKFPTVYAIIDYVKTDASSKLREEHLDQTSEWNVT